MKRFTALLLILSMCLALFSCKGKKSETVFAYGDAVMDENMYYYELAMMKSEFLSSYGVKEDVPEVWKTEITEGSGSTYDDLVYAQCQLNICSTLYYANIAIQAGGLDAEEKKAVEKSVNEIIDNFGSKKKTNGYLKNYSMDIEKYREYLTLYSLASKGSSLAYAVGGEREISYEEAYRYYTENYVTVKHIAIGNVYSGTDKDGNMLYLTDEEKKAKDLVIDTVEKLLSEGTDFDSLVSYSEDKFIDEYPNGYTITTGVLDEKLKPYEDIAMHLKEGEWKKCEIEDTGVYFIERVPINPDDFENCKAHIMKALIEKDMAECVLEHYKEFTMNQGIIDNYNMASVPVIK